MQAVCIPFAGSVPGQAGSISTPSSICASQPSHNGDPCVAQDVAATITRYQTRGTPIRAVMLERLGPNVWHDSPAAAMATLEELEELGETAKLWCLSQRQSATLSAESIDELRQTFGAQW